MCFIIYKILERRMFKYLPYSLLSSLCNKRVSNDKVLIQVNGQVIKYELKMF